MLARANEWGVDPRRLGMVGFSAGAMLTLQAALHVKTMKLAFIAPVYGDMGPVDVPKDAPPMFNVIAADDFLFRGQFGVVKSWFDAGRPVEFHLYQNGGHGFGLGYPGNTANGWLPVFVHWLEVNGLFEPAAAAVIGDLKHGFNRPPTRNTRLARTACSVSRWPSKSPRRQRRRSCCFSRTS